MGILGLGMKHIDEEVDANDENGINERGFSCKY